MRKSIRIALDAIIGVGIGCSLDYMFGEYSVSIILAILLVFDEIQIHLLKKELKQIKGRYES